MGTKEVSINRTLLMPVHYSTHKVYKLHVNSSQADYVYSPVLLVPSRSELTAHSSRYITGERTWTYSYSKHISRDRYPASLLARRSDLQKTQIPLLLRVAPWLQCCWLTTRWSNPLYSPSLRLLVPSSLAVYRIPFFLTCLFAISHLSSSCSFF
jgi:hypothetical protein